MTTKTWLALSLILNLFLIAAGIGAAVVIHKHMHDLRKPMMAEKQWDDARSTTTPDERKQVYALVKAAALTAEDDLKKAHDLRMQVAKLAGTDPYDAAQIAVLSEQARNAEADARAKIENNLILSMKDLKPNQRTFLATTMLRGGTRFGRFIARENKAMGGAPMPPGAVGAPPPEAAPASK